MAPAHSFDFTEIRVGGERVLRPDLPVVLTGPAGSIRASMLLDSGADISMVGLGLARALGLDLSTRDRVFGVSGSTNVFRSSVLVEVLVPTGRTPALRIPLWVPTKAGLPPEPILGREVFFQENEVTFDMGRGAKGRFTVTPRPRRSG